MPTMEKTQYSWVDDTDIFFTVTLSPDLYQYDCRSQQRKTFNKLESYLQKHCDKYFMVAELTKDCNIHYHIMLRLHPLNLRNDDGEIIEDVSSLAFLDDYKGLLKHGFGFKKFEKTQNKLNTYNYLIKDISKTNKILNPKNKNTLDIWQYWVAKRNISQIVTNVKNKLPKAVYTKIDNDILDDWDEDIFLKPDRASSSDTMRILNI